MKKYTPFILFVLLCLCIGWLGGMATSTSVNSWYLTIQKPSFNPPSWVFAPVWSTLYVLIGIAGGFLWKIRKQSPAFSWYVAQLLFNALWSFLFFGFQQIGLALIDIIVIWIILSFTIYYSWNTSRIAVYLLLPYWLWGTFAAVLNASIWLLN